MVLLQNINCSLTQLSFCNNLPGVFYLYIIAFLLLLLDLLFSCIMFFYLKEEFPMFKLTIFNLVIKVIVANIYLYTLTHLIAGQLKNNKWTYLWL